MSGPLRQGKEVGEGIVFDVSFYSLEETFRDLGLYRRLYLIIIDYPIFVIDKNLLEETRTKTGTGEDYE